MSDFAIWNPIETAPKDGWDSPILTCRMGEPEACFEGLLVGGYAEPPEAAYWNQDGDCWTPIQRPHDVWLPTHWKPLPAAPGAQPSQPDALAMEREFSRGLQDLLKKMFDAPTMAAGYAILADFSAQFYPGKPVALQPAQGGSVSEAAECRRILEEMAALFEMDDEANEPGTDSYTVLWQAREFLSAARASAPEAPEVVDCKALTEAACDIMDEAASLIESGNAPGAAQKAIRDQGLALLRQSSGKIRAAVRAAGEAANG